MQDRTKPLRLETAAKIIFGADSNVDGRSLYRASRPEVEEDKRLHVFEIMGKLFTTIADVQDWIARQRTRPVPSPTPAADLTQAIARARSAIEAAAPAASS